MKAGKYSLFVLFFIKSLCFNVFGQQQKPMIDSILDLIEMEGVQKSNASIFVHFDKNIYCNNEYAWFTAYMLEDNTNAIHHTLSVALVRNFDRSILSEAKYVMENSIAMCNMILPDSLPVGNYSFICYTNQMVDNYPTALFVQPITIKTNRLNGFNATCNFIDTTAANLDTTKVLLRATNKDGTLVKGATVKYYIGNGIEPYKKVVLKTDNFGEATILVSLNEITSANNYLHVEINNGSVTKSFSIKLPSNKKQAQVKFYPEGGNLVDGCKNTVGWEVSNALGEPLQIDASLFRNETLLETISTNEFGMGTFSIKPEIDSHYYVKLHTVNPEVLHELPVSLQKGTVLRIPHALASDTLYALLGSYGATGKMNLIIHNYYDVFVNYQIQTSGKTRLIKIPLNDIPKGVTSIILLDSIGRPVLERLFFAHYDKRAILSINTDSTIYKTRQKVILKFNVTNADHRPLLANVSISCAQNNRFDLKKSIDIESYLYLTNVLASFPYKKNSLKPDPENEFFLEQLFLVKGWRRYTWQDTEKTKLSAKTPRVSSLNFSGKAIVADNKKRIPLQLKLQKLITSKMSELEYITTDSSGNFDLRESSLVCEPGLKFRISVNTADTKKFTISVNNPYILIDKNLAISLPFKDFAEYTLQQTSQALVLPKNEVSKTLEKVIVTSEKESDRIFSIPGPNICGDYVCLNNILNCSYHTMLGVQPVVGKFYWTRILVNSEKFREVIYKGCVDLANELSQKKETHFELDGIYSKKEFYVTDFSKSPISETQFLSTIYWNHSVLTDIDGKSEVSFYTGDITGKFKIVIQGVAGEANVVYGEHFFEVTEP